MNPGLMSLVSFSVAALDCALPVTHVDRVLPSIATSPLPGAPCTISGVVNFAGQPVPVFNLRHRLGLPPKAMGVAGRMLVVASSTRRFIITADSATLLEASEASIADSSEVAMFGARFIASLVPSQTGLLLICDPDAFLSIEDERQLDLALLRG
jgi:purine-binding chemotaxis protein CheW